MRADARRKTLPLETIPPPSHVAVYFFLPLGTYSVSFVLHSGLHWRLLTGQSLQLGCGQMEGHLLTVAKTVLPLFFWRTRDSNERKKWL